MMILLESFGDKSHNNVIKPDQGFANNLKC